MNSERIKVFTTKKAENAHALVGILKQYNIHAEVIQMNDSYEIHVNSGTSEAAKVLITKHIRKPGSSSLNTVKASFLDNYRVTSIIIALLLITFFLTSFGRYMDQASGLFFNDIEYIRSVKDNRFIEVAQYTNSLEAITKGQIWRVITPSLLHKNLIHFLLIIIFMIQFGRTIENTSGRAYLTVLCVISSITCNFIEYKLSGVHFGGMSGVILSLYGFIWMRSTTDLKYAGKLHVSIHIFMAAIVLCGLMNIFFINNRLGSIAGLVIGMLWGFLSCNFLPKDRRIPKKEKLL
jgi:membrane associated rhomboid family serine protease